MTVIRLNPRQGQGVVYIQILRWSRSLCVIIEAHNVLKNFWILLKISGILIYSTGNQNMLVPYLHVFCVSLFSLEKFYHTFHNDMIQMSFTHEETPLWGCTHNVCEKKFKIKWYMKKHKHKSTFIILVPSQRYKNFWQLLQNPKFPKTVLGFSNHAQRFTPPYLLI